MSLPDDRYRRLAATIMGAALSLIFGIVTQLVERLLVPGVPLYQPPFGALANLAGLVVGGAVLGLMIAWPRSPLVGASGGAVVTVILLLVYNAFTAGERGSSATQLFLSSFFLALPLWGLMVAALGALRWAAGHLEEGRRDHLPWRVRLTRPVVLAVVIGLAGSFLLLPARARPLLTETQAMIRAGQAASSRDALPAPLAAPAAGDFLASGQGPYEMSWDAEEILRYRIPRPLEKFDEQSVVVTRFKNGWNLVCLYIAAGREPICQETTQLPR